MKYGEANLLAVRVYKPFPYCQFDCSDDWALSGIFRDVVVRSLPSPHIAQLWTTTQPGEPALVTVEGTLDSFGEALPGGLTLAGSLSLPHGAAVAKFDVPVEPGTATFKCSLDVPEPRWWTAETPNLYELAVQLKKDGTPVHGMTRAVGLSRVAIEDGVFKVAGSPVKLRGREPARDPSRGGAGGARGRRPPGHPTDEGGERHAGAHVALPAAPAVPGPVRRAGVVRDLRGAVRRRRGVAERSGQPGPVAGARRRDRAAEPPPSQHHPLEPLATRTRTRRWSRRSPSA